MKKIVPLAMAAAALAICALPATALAYEHWTANGNTIGEGETFEESYEGFLSFTTPAVSFPLPPVHSTFGCATQIRLYVEEGNTARVVEFNPTTATCVGTGVFANCKLKAHSSSVPWGVNLFGESLTINGLVGVSHAYEGCTSGVSSSTLTFSSLTAMPTLNESGGIVSIAISGKATNGVTVISGSVAPVFFGDLGLE